MIALNNISVSFSGHDLFNDISFVINPKDRIGLVGKNGVGKSTLLNIIASKQEPDKGSVAITEGKTIGYLPQEMHFDSERSVIDETMSVFEEVHRLNKEIEEINQQLADREDYQSDSYAELIQSLTEKHERLGVLDNDKMESNVEKVLKGLGFSADELRKPVSQFSGGWQMRVELAKLLLLRPSLLLLDEPTNHLDIESIMWLEEYFINYPGAILMISHDHMFLDNITNRTIEIVFGKTYDYKVAYTKYFELREERFEQQKAAYKNQQKFIEQQERFIERFKAKNTKAKQVQSKIKQLDKIERVEFDELDHQSINFHFPPAPRSGDISLKAKRATKRYGNHEVLNNLDFEIERGERIAFVGKNGEGKTTLVKMITGETDFSGEVKLGHNVTLGYYAQVQEKTLDPDLTVLQVIEKEATGEWAKIHKIRGLLGAFLFGPNDVDKKVKVLSGGEKSRLALARLLLNPINLLILDEPTNHLDISAKEVLKEALLNYNGTLILVSHDRKFLQGLTNRTFEFKNKGIKEHLGSINEFLEKYKVENFREFETSDKEKTQPSKKKNAAPKANEYELKKTREKEERKLRKQLGTYESKINKLESQIEEMEQTMQDPDFYMKHHDANGLLNRHARYKKELGELMSKWEETALKLE